MTPRRWLIFVSGLLVVLASLEVIACWQIDPFGLWFGNRPAQPRFVMRHPRMYKPHALERFKPEVLLLGSSRVEQGLDPDRPSLGGKAFNAAIPGCTLYEMRRHLQHALAVAPVRRVVAELALFAYRTDIPTTVQGFSEARLAVDGNGNPQPWHRLSDVLNTCASLEAFEAMLATSVPFNPNRMEVESIYQHGANSPEQIQRLFGKHPNRVSFDVNLAGFVCDIYPQMKIRDDQGQMTGLEEIRRIVRLCRDHGVALTFFYSPEHARQTWSIQVAKRWDMYEDVKRSTVALVAEEYPAAEVWDFSPVSPVTAEGIPPASQHERTMRYYNDGGHYRRALGDLVLDRLTGGGRDDFGVRLTSATVDAELSRQRLALERWAQECPNEAAQVEIITRNPPHPPED